MIKPVQPKKRLGQHFLHDRNIACKIVESLTGHGDYKSIVEVGAGMGILTQYLVNKESELWIVEIDNESVEYLKIAFPKLEHRLINQDFLLFDPATYIKGKFAVIGNFPYNISSQILFHILNYRDNIPEIVGMFQREVALRIASPPRSKAYGILSVLLQTWYDIEYLFTVPPTVFLPPPAVQSAVIRLKRNNRKDIDCDAKLYTNIVRTAFGQRRKTLRNSLKQFSGMNLEQIAEYQSKRAEELKVDDFILITKTIAEAKM